MVYLLKMVDLSTAMLNNQMVIAIDHEWISTDNYTLWFFNIAMENDHV